MRVAGESLTLSSARREYGLVAGDQSAARLARVIIGHVGGDVHTETVARELVVHSFFNQSLPLNGQYSCPRSRLAGLRPDLERS